MPNKKPKPKRRRAWLRRLLGFGVVSFFLLLLAVLIGLKWAHSHRVELANRFLQKARPLSGIVTEVDFDHSGNIEVRGLELTEPVSGVKLMRVPKLTGRVDWSTVASGKVKEIKLDQPEIILDEKALATLLNQPLDAASGSALPAQGIHVGIISIEKAAVSLKQADGTTAKLIVSYHSSETAISSSGQISTGDQELLIEEGQLSASEESTAPITLKRLHMKGRVHDGFIELDHLTCDEPELRLKPALLAMFAPSSEASSSAVTVKPDVAKVVQAAAAAAPFPIKGVRIANIQVHSLGISTAGFLAGNSSGLTLPDAKGDVTYEASDVEWPFDGLPTTGTQKLHIDKLDLQSPDQSGHVRCQSANITVAITGAGHPWRVEKCDLDGLDVNWTEAFRKWLMPSDTSKGDAPTTPAAAPAPWSVKLADVNLTNAKVHIADPTLMDFALDTNGNLKVDDLTLDNTGWHSAKMQSLALKDVRLVFPSADAAKPGKPFFELPHGELQLCPDKWTKDMQVEKLVLMRPVVRLRDGNTPWLKADDDNERSVAGKQVDIAAGKKPADVEAPWWTLLDFAELLVKDGSLDVLTEEAKPLDAHVSVNITTEKLADGVLHRLTVGEMEARLPTLSKEPVPIVQGATITCVARVPQVWSERVLEELTLSGASILAGKALMQYFEEPAKPKSDEPKPDQEPKKPAPAAAQAGPELSPWFCRRIDVQDCFVTLENVVPGMPSLRFELSFDAENTPLTTDDLADNVKPQRIELANLRIPSPHNPLEHVAQLDSIFVDFTLRGLFHKEIDRIQIINPTLLVGQPLFEYVDFYRKYTAQGVVPNAKEPRIAANDEELEFGVANTVIDGEQPASNAVWSIRTLQVHNGKLVIAPKGKPLKGFRTPFPFSFTTELKSGTMEADFEIPKGDYEVEELKLRFEGLSGKVLFNLPMKSRDNNVTQYFNVQHIRYKELRTGKAFLSVTYDKDGIYGKFGAEAYEGYVNGGFDVFLDESFSWDLWVNGDKVQTTELTEKLCPGYFFMDGKVEAKVIAQGNMNELYQADIKYKNVTPGHFSIKALNGVLKDLPKGWDDVKKQMTTIGLETMRDFDYDKSDASFRFYGREGLGNLKFQGPNGSRNFLINVYDHRWKTDPPQQIVGRKATP